MSRRDDDTDQPFVHVRVGGRSWRRGWGSRGEGEDVIDMERDDYDEYRAVKRRVRSRLRFARHLFTFLALNGLFVLLDWSTGGEGGGVNWAQWVALVWGVFLAWEFVSNFVGPALWGRDMEERLIERELRRRRRGV